MKKRLICNFPNKADTIIPLKDLKRNCYVCGKRLVKEKYINSDGETREYTYCTKCNK